MDDSTIRRLTKATRTATSVKALDEQFTRLGVPELPAKMREMLETCTETELYLMVGETTMEALQKAIRLAARIQTRCGVCRDSGSLCAHCHADGLVLNEITGHALLLVRVVAAATAPGTRVNAQREAARETTSKEPKA